MNAVMDMICEYWVGLRELVGVREVCILEAFVGILEAFVYILELFTY